MNEKKKARKQRRKKITLIAVIFVVVICLCAHLFVNSQLVKGVVYREGNYASNTVLEVDKSISGSYSVFGDNIIFKNKNGVHAYNQKGELVNTENYDEVSAIIAGFASPVIRSEGDYLLSFDSSGRRMVVFNNKKILHREETEYNLQSAKVFEDGGFLAITGDAGAKNQAVFYDSKGEKFFIWHSGVDNILDGTVLNGGKKLAVLTSELASGIISSKLLFFNKGEAEAYATVLIEDAFVTNIEACGSRIVALSDEGLYYYNSDGRKLADYSFNDKFLKYFRILENGTAVLSFGSVSISLNTVEIVNKKGKLKGSYSTDEEILDVDCRNNNILLTHKNSADILSMKGNLIRHLEFDREMKKVAFIGRNKIVLIGNSEVKIIK